MTECPVAVLLLLKLWETDDRFVPEGIRRPTTCDGELLNCLWIGEKAENEQGLALVMFHHWTKIDQQAMLEAAAGKIFSLMATYSKTVVQIQGNAVSIKHREFKQVRRFKSQKVMLANLFNAVIKMVEVPWLPMFKAKDDKYYYTQDSRDKADHEYELLTMKAAKSLLEKQVVEGRVSILPKDDPFVDDFNASQGNVNIDMQRLKAELQQMKEAIGNKEGYISSWDWRP